jgi:hypothetical protein
MGAWNHSSTNELLPKMSKASARMSLSLDGTIFAILADLTNINDAKVYLTDKLLAHFWTEIIDEKLFCNWAEEFVQQVGTQL